MGPSSSARVRASKRVLSSSLAIWLLAAKRHAGRRGGLVDWRDRVPMTITDVLAHSDARYSADDSR